MTFARISEATGTPVSGFYIPVSHCEGDVELVNSSVSATATESLVVYRCVTCKQERVMSAYDRRLSGKHVGPERLSVAS